MVAKSKNKIKRTWNIIKKGTGKGHPNEQDPSLLVNNEELTFPSMAVNAFNNFFLTVTEKLNTQKPEKGDVLLFLRDSFPGNFTNIKISYGTKTVTRTCVCQEIHHRQQYISQYI
jgi:hypothetical protein